jgi:hypothetical protein
VDVLVGAETGVDFCASFSGRLVIDCSAGEACDTTSACGGTSGGLMSLTRGMVPAIDVSGMVEFRGGGGTESSEYGW